MSPEAVFLALSARPVYYGDLSEPKPEREIRLHLAADAIAAAAKTRLEAAMLVALAFSETALSRDVQYGHCDALPAGQRCDNGKARGLFQLHEAACPAAYALPIGSPESLKTEALCAIRLLRWNAQRGREHTLTPEHAAFCGYAAKSWEWKGADARVRTTREILARWGRP